MDSAKDKKMPVPGRQTIAVLVAGVLFGVIVVAAGILGWWNSTRIRIPECALLKDIRRPLDRDITDQLQRTERLHLHLRRKMKKYRVFLLSLGALLLALGMAGCGKAKPDFFVLAENANGIAVESKVMWRGVEVGKVTAVSPEAGKIRLDAVLLKEYRGQLRTGIKAKPMKNLTGENLPVLNLFGGADPAAPVLPKGSQIPEATFFETLQNTNFWDWFSAAGVGKWSILFIFGGILLAGIAWKVLKGLSRLLILVAAIAMVAGTFWVIRYQWDKYKTSMVSPEMQQQVDEMLNFNLKNPEAKEAWQSIKTDVNELLDAAKKQGIAATGSVRASIDATISQKVADLRKQGKEAAAAEIERIRESVTEFQLDERSRNHDDGL